MHTNLCRATFPDACHTILLANYLTSSIQLTLALAASREITTSLCPRAAA